jgi:hypothetical protein
MATTISPKESRGALEPVPNTYAVENGVLYDYYPVKLGDRKGDFVTITKLPPLLREGFVTYQKKLFKVELRDFFRSRVNVGKPYVAAADGTNANTTATSDSVVSAELGQPSTTPDKQGTVDTSGIQVDEAVDLAWEEQIRALLTLDDPEAQWDFKTATQS